MAGVALEVVAEHEAGPAGRARAVCGEQVARRAGDAHDCAAALLAVAAARQTCAVICEEAGAADSAGGGLEERVRGAARAGGAAAETCLALHVAARADSRGRQVVAFVAGEGPRVEQHGGGQVVQAVGGVVATSPAGWQTLAADRRAVEVVAVCADGAGAVLDGQVRVGRDGDVEGVGTGETAVDRPATQRTVSSCAGPTPAIHWVDEVVHVAADQADHTGARGIEERVLRDA